jgi:hypothetical protein
MKRALVSILLLAAGVASAQTPVRVTVSGEVDHPGELVFDGKPRLDDVVKAAQVNRDAYVLGAAWLRPSLMTSQTRLKTGLTYELGLIDDKAMTAGHEQLAVLAQRTRDWIATMPVTGRQVVRTLEPHELQVSLADNYPIYAGDQLTYPLRPKSVTVVGAVEQFCDVPHAQIQDARGYLAQCASSPYADPDILYVIEPDGNVFELGIALWNRSPAMPVAPGAILYVPFARRATHDAADEAFNRDMANFIATQPLGGIGTKP